jgi:hypothetical protein
MVTVSNGPSPPARTAHRGFLEVCRRGALMTVFILDDADRFEVMERAVDDEDRGEVIGISPRSSNPRRRLRCCGCVARSRRTSDTEEL